MKNRNKGNRHFDLAKPGIFLFITILMLSLGQSASLSFVSPNQGDNVEIGSELTVEWSSTQDHASSDTLISSNIVVTGPDGNEYSKYLSRSTTLSNGQSTTESYTISNGISDLNDGQWTISITDTYDSETTGQSSIDLSVSRTESSSGSHTLSINSPSSGSTEDVVGGITVEWSSTNDYEVEKTLGSSNVLLEGASGRTVNKQIDQNKLFSAGGSQTHTASFSESELSDIDTGSAVLQVTDNWDSKQDIPQESLSQDVSFQTENSSSGKEETFDNLQGSVSVSGVSPSGSTVDVANGLTVGWTSNNNYDGDRVIGSSRVEVTGDQGRSYSKTIQRGSTVGVGSSTSYQFSVPESELGELELGQFDLKIDDTWEAETGAEEETVSGSSSFETVNSSESSQTASLLTGSVSSDILDPSPNDDLDVGDGFSVSWESQNNYNGTRNISDSRVEVTGDQGRSVIRTVSRNENVQQNQNTSYTFSLSESDLSDLSTGKWTVSVEDTWASSPGVSEESVSDSLSFSASGSSDSSSSGSGGDDTTVVDDSNTDDSNTDGSSGGESTSTNETSETTENSDSENTDQQTDSTDEETGGQSTNSGSDDDSSSTGGVVTDDGSVSCPDGFSYDEEREVCVEDTSDSNTSASESSEETDETSSEPTGDPSPLQQEVAGGITVQTVGIVGLIVLVVGLLFRRSSYKLAF